MIQDYSITLKEYEANKRLAQKGIVSVIELQRIESRLSTKRTLIEQTNISIQDNSTQINSKKAALVEFDNGIEDLRNKYKQTLQVLKAEINAWKSNFLLISPEHGRIVFPFLWQENQNVIAGQDLFYINKIDSPIIGIVALPQRNIGKVKKGQKTIVKFQGYPHEEFGVVVGKVTEISEMADKDANFLLTIEFGNDLTTTRGNIIIPKTGMIAQADVITQDMTLLERLFYQLKRLTTN